MFIIKLHCSLTNAKIITSIFAPNMGFKCFNLLFILPLSGVIMSPSLATTTDSRVVSYRYHLQKRTKTPEIKCPTKFEQTFTKNTIL